MSKKVKRLYMGFAPDHYDVNLDISEDKLSFSGEIQIKGKKQSRPSKRITLHQKNLVISNPLLTYTDRKGLIKYINVKRIVHHAKYDEIRLHTDELLYPGTYTIKLSFSGKITENMDGIYPCNFDDRGLRKKLISTQFESHHAREAFPCIDEPEAKATFQLSLTHDSRETALSNTDVVETKTTNDRTITKFAITPLMSTYLMAFVVGELKYKEALAPSGVKIRTYCIPKFIDTVDFALDVAVKAMKYYEEYYDIPFPLPKCDFVALPDFASGAMENWGLITFREQLLLCDKHTSLNTKQYIAIVIAHELTHQWFGNLVTMRWWTDLWLNEGFASWMEYLAVDHIFPEWHLWRQFAVDEQQTALKADSLEHTHPIEVPVKHPDEIRTIFDIISYQKGSSVIHMLHNYLGADEFRDGLRYYLKEYSYKNADTTDLWQSLETITNKPIKKFMSSWTSQSGYPLLMVSRKDDHLVVQQQRFVTNPSSKARNDNSLWPIPLLSKDLDQISVIKKSTNIPIPKNKQITKINIGQTGFYRVEYSRDIQKLQLSMIDNNELDDIDKMGLLSDGFEITKAGYQPVSEYLNLIEHYQNEDSLAVWEIIISSLGAIKNNLSKGDKDEELRELMKPFIRNTIKQQLERLGWNKKRDESHLDSLLRPLIISTAASADEPKTLKKCLDLYKQKIDRDKHLDPDMRAIIYSTAARLGGQKEFDELFNLYRATHSNDEKLSITAAMTSFRQRNVNKKVLDLIISEDVRLQDIGYWIAYSFMNRYAREMTWDWLKENWQQLKSKIGTDLSFARIPVYAARNFASNQHLKEYKEFFEDKMEPLLNRSFYQGLEIIETNNAWRMRDRKIAIDWFKARLG